MNNKNADVELNELLDSTPIVASKQVVEINDDKEMKIDTQTPVENINVVVEVEKQLVDHGDSVVDLKDIKLFFFDISGDWIAALNSRQAIECIKEEMGYGPIDGFDLVEVLDENLDVLMIHNDDTGLVMHSFREHLNVLAEENSKFPTVFASCEM